MDGSFGNKQCSQHHLAATAIFLHADLLCSVTWLQGQTGANGRTHHVLNVLENDVVTCQQLLDIRVATLSAAAVNMVSAHTDWSCPSFPHKNGTPDTFGGHKISRVLS